MAFIKKSVGNKPQVRGAAEFEIEATTIPNDFVRKFPELEEFNRQQEAFWVKLRDSIVRMEDRLATLEQTTDEQQVTIDAQLATLADLTTRVTALEVFHP